MEVLNATSSGFSAESPLPGLTSESIEITPLFEKKGAQAAQTVKANNNLKIEPTMRAALPSKPKQGGQQRQADKLSPNGDAQQADPEIVPPKEN